MRRTSTFNLSRVSTALVVAIVFGGSFAFSQDTSVEFERVQYPGAVFDSLMSSQAWAHVAFPIEAEQNDDDFDDDSNGPERDLCDRELSTIEAWDVFWGMPGLYAEAIATAHSMQSKISLSENDTSESITDSAKMLNGVLKSKVLGGPFPIGFSMANSNIVGSSHYSYELETNLVPTERALVTVPMIFAVSGGSTGPAGEQDEITLFRNAGGSHLKAVFDGQGWDVTGVLQRDSFDTPLPAEIVNMRVEGRNLFIGDKEAKIMYLDDEQIAVVSKTDYNVHVGCGNIMGAPQEDNTRFKLTNLGQVTGVIENDD